MIEEHVANPGMRSVCIREVQKSLRDSAKMLLEDRLTEFKLGRRDGFRVFNEVIQTPGDGVIVFQGMNNHTAESIKSLEGFSRAWVEEAQTLSIKSLQLLRPTIRTPGSELWFSWNPRRKGDPVDKLFRAEKPSDAIVVRSNWSDNPWFPTELNQERLDDKRINPDQYPHVWDGEYASVISGAYFAKQLVAANESHRICHLVPDPLMSYKCFFDIGGTGVKSDACAIWVAQFVGKEIRLLDYYEAVGQPLSVHVAWLKHNGYGDAHIYLPHDGVNHDRVFDVSYESELRKAGFDVSIVKNQGAGAAMARVHALRRIFPQLWFNTAKTQPGLDALGWYHEKYDENRSVGLGPEHDWSSHCCDAAGMLAIVAEDIFDEHGHRPESETYKIHNVGWMG